MKPFGISLGRVNIDLSQPKYPRGIPLAGMAHEILRHVALSKGALWSIQQGKVDIIDQKKPVTGGVTVMNSNTGMIGWPQQTPDGVLVRSLLNPALQPNGRVQINQKSIQQAEQDNNPVSGAGSQKNFDLTNTGLIARDGIYRIIFMTRAGDTRGSDWFDESMCIAAQGASPNEAELNAGYGLGFS